MFDRLDDLLIRYEELMSELQEPDVANDANRFRKLMKEQSDLAPLVEAYTEYKNAKQAIVITSWLASHKMSAAAHEIQICKKQQTIHVKIVQH